MYTMCIRYSRQPNNHDFYFKSIKKVGAFYSFIRTSPFLNNWKKYYAYTFFTYAIYLTWLVIKKIYTGKLNHINETYAQEDQIFLCDLSYMACWEGWKTRQDERDLLTVENWNETVGKEKIFRKKWSY